AYSDGANPYFGRLLQPSDGFLYGTTPGGGTYGTGVVYRLDTSGNFAILHAFNNTDGAYPYGPLIQATDGLFYGTTSGGGANGAGTVYRLDGGGALETLHAFNSADGANPLAALLETTDGKLYGTTVGGGIGYGTVFRITLGPVTQLSVSAAGVYGGPISLSATLTAGGSPIAGRQVTFSVNAVFFFSAVTDMFGTATVSGVNLGFFSAGTYPNVVNATFAGDATYAPSSALGDLVVAKATPIITWPAPAPIAFGAPLDGTQLNATTNAFGTFVYNP